MLCHDDRDGDDDGDDRDDDDDRDDGDDHDANNDKDDNDYDGDDYDYGDYGGDDVKVTIMIMMKMVITTLKMKFYPHFVNILSIGLGTFQPT